MDVRDAKGNPVLNEPITSAATAPLDPEFPIGTFSPVIDQGDGTYLTTYTSSSQAGDVTIIATASNGTTGAIVLEQRSPAASMTVETVDSQLVADRISQTAVTVTVIDTEGNPAPDKSVEISANIGQISELQDKGDGTYTATYVATTTTTGEVTITAQTEHNVKASAQIGLVAGPATGIELRILDTELSADGSSTATLHVELSDRFNNPVTGANLQFTLIPVASAAVSNTEAFGVVQNIIDKNNGSYAATYIAGTMLGDVIIRVSVGEVHDEGTITLTQLPPAEFTVTANPPEPVADGKTIVTLILTVTDVIGHPISNLSVSVNANPGQIGTSTTDVGNGSYTTTYVPGTLVSPVTIVATASDGKTSVISPPLTLNLKPGPPSPSASTIVIEKEPESEAPVKPPADGFASVAATVMVRDQHNNLIPGATVTITASGGGTTLTPLTQVTDEDGVAAVEIRSTVPGVKVTTATVSAPQNGETIELQAHPSVRFNSAEISTITFLEAPTELKADGETTTTLTFSTQNAEGQPISNAAISLAATVGSISSPAKSIGNGLYQATYTAPEQIGTLTITPTPENGNPASINLELLPGDVSLTESLVEIEPGEVLSDGVSTLTIMVTIRDRNRNPIPNRSVRIAATGAGVEITQPMSLTDENGQATGSIRSTIPGKKTIVVDDNTDLDVSRPLLSNPAVMFLPRAPASMTVTPESTNLPADGESRTTINIQVLDAVGNPVEAGDVMLTASAGTIPARAVNQENGTYISTYISPNLAQVVTITARIGGGISGTAEITLDRADFTLPTFEAFVVKSKGIELIFSEPVVGGDRMNWTVDDEPVLDFVGVGTTYLITTAQPKPPDANPVVRYKSVSGSEGERRNDVTDHSGNPLPDDTTVIAQDRIPPLYSARVTDERTISITFSEPVFGEVHELFRLPDGWFVTLESTALRPLQFTRTEADDLIWELEIEPPFQGGESPILRYDAALGDLADKGGNPLPSDPVTAQPNSAPTLLLTDSGGNPLRGDRVPLSVREGETIEITVTGEDQEGEVLTFEITPLDGATFRQASSTNYQFIYVPPFDTATAADVDGVVKTVTFSVTEGRFAARQDIAFTILNVSQSAQIAVATSPNRLLADGVGQATVTVTVIDATGLPVIDEVVTLNTTEGAIDAQAVHQDAGAYTGIYTVSEDVGPAIITAITSNGISGETQIIQLPGEPATLTLKSDVTELPADEVSQANLSVGVFDALRRPIDEIEIHFVEPDTGFISAAIPQGGGIHRATYTAGRIAGDLESAEITLAVTVGTGQPLSLTSSVIFTLIQPNRLPMLTLLDAEGNPIDEEKPIFRLVEGDEISLSLYAEDPDGDGITLSAEGVSLTGRFDPSGVFQWETDTSIVKGIEVTKDFPVRFIATDGEGGATIREIQITVVHVSPAARLLISANPDSPVASEGAIATLTMILTDGEGVRLSGERIELTVIEPQTGLAIGQVSEVIDNGSGVYTATHLAPTQAGPAQLIATVPNTQVSATLDLQIRPATLVELFIIPVQSQTLRAGEAVIFKAFGRDRFQNVIDLSNGPTGGNSQTDMRWEVQGEIGEIDANGVFVATTVGIGHVEAIVSIHAMDASTPTVIRQSSGEIAVIPGVIAQLHISPEIRQIRIGEPQIFEVEGTDSFGNTVEIRDEDTHWEVIGEIGGFAEQDDILPHVEGKVVTFEPTTLGIGQIRVSVSASEPSVGTKVAPRATDYGRARRNCDDYHHANRHQAGSRCGRNPAVYCCGSGCAWKRSSNPC